MLHFGDEVLVRDRVVRFDFEDDDVGATRVVLEVLIEVRAGDVACGLLNLFGASGFSVVWCSFCAE